MDNLNPAKIVPPGAAQEAGFAGKERKP